MKTMQPSDLQHLADHGFVVVEDFLSESLRDDLREDVVNLRSLDLFKIAKIGHDGLVQDENVPFRDIRFSETCFIGKAKEPGPTSKARQQLYNVLDELKVELNTNDVVKHGHLTKNVPSLDSDLEELMYAYYPRGGYYRRHRDAEPESVSNWRRYSLLLYLNENWKPEDGGQLRIHRDSGGDELPLGELPNYIDIQPKAGTLVLFRSDLCPHEVLDTSKERIAIVGWFLSEEQQVSTSAAEPTSTNQINPDTLKALRTLRDASPRLKAKLIPSPPQNNSGMLGDDFCFPGMEPSTVPALEEFPDTDVRYWKKIATFDLDGHISTLSLGGNRLRHLSDEWRQPSFLQYVVTLDIGNTDLSATEIVAILKQCSTDLRSLHLGGNALGDSGVEELLSEVEVISQLKTLDLRYNDIGPEGAGALGRLLRQKAPEAGAFPCTWNTLYLEGNRLGDAGAAAFSSYGTLTEVLLGQNRIGPAGATSLAHALKEPNRLKKISLDGNQIGDEGAMAFANVLDSLDKEAKTLEKLFVDNNGIDKQMSIRLGGAVNSATCIGEGGIFEEIGNKSPEAGNEEIQWTDKEIRFDGYYDLERVNKKEMEEGDGEGVEEDDGNDIFKFDDPKQTFCVKYSQHPTNNNAPAPIEIALKGYKSDSNQTWDSTGLTVWNASYVLCDYIHQHYATIIKPRLLTGGGTTTSTSIALELGCGLGLCGLLVHQLLNYDDDTTLDAPSKSTTLTPSTTTTTTTNTIQVHLTDGDTDALKQLRSNIQEYNYDRDNYCATDGGGGGGGSTSTTTTHSSSVSLVCNQLLWSESNAKHYLQNKLNNQKCHLILAADVIYAKDIVRPLFETVEILLLDQQRQHRMGNYDTNSDETIDDNHDTNNNNNYTNDTDDDGLFLLVFCQRKVPVNIDDVLSTATEIGFHHKLCSSSSSPMTETTTNDEESNHDGIYVIQFWLE